MKNLSSGFTIPWEDFNQALRGEQIFHAQYCPDNKDVCLGVWLDRWCYCDSYVGARMWPSEEYTIRDSTHFSSRRAQITIA